MSLQREEQEQIRINVPDGNILAPQNHNSKFITCVVLLALTIAGMFSFCLILFHHSVKDPCYSQATLDKNGWTLSSAYCVQQIDNVTLEIRSAGVYLIDIQVHAQKETGITDLVLKVNKKEFIGGAFQTPHRNECYAKLSQTLQLYEGDQLLLTINGLRRTFSFDNRTNYWKMVKVLR
ncbi:hypothetical protein GDO81_017827 [Engystomops pustulosus]|uniref:TNF family profile domain-containing protein n=1 Tax=Engystomops pustulosus TaxID=76066 RepID=A0AAV7A939_ENGPU|nr:hypothetical protein GDO81_017827 [Engystomops pustulosus]